MELQFKVGDEVTWSRFASHQDLHGILFIQGRDQPERIVIEEILPSVDTDYVYKCSFPETTHMNMLHGKTREIRGVYLRINTTK